MNLSVNVDLREFERSMSLLQRLQLPFAAAQALTYTAQDVQLEVRRELPERFTLRRDWIVKGIRFKPANKVNLTATVESVDPFMALQESGGTKTSIRRRVFDYGDFLAVPLDARRSKRDVVAKADWPQNLVHPFILTARDGRKYLAVHALGGGRNGPRAVASMRGRNRRDTGTRLMYRLVPKVDLRKRLMLVDTARKLVPSRFPRHLGLTLRAALEGAR